MVAAVGVALLAGGCGGNATKLAKDQIAVVCGEPVTRAQFDELIRQGKAVYKLQHQPFPAVGTARYATIKRHVIDLLVQHAEQREAAAKMGINITDAQVAANLRQLVAAQFHGDAKAFERAAGKEGVTPQAMRDTIRSNLLQKAIAAKVTAKLKVSDAEIRAYYARNRAQYKSRPSRSMRAIYVKTKARAEALGALLRHGADFATLARRSSLDPAAKKTGGKFLYQQGMLGSADDAAVRALPVGQISKPVRFGTSWALLVPLGPVQAPHQVPLDQVRLPIVQYLLGQKRQRKLTSWMNGVKQSCAKNARFAKGYELTS